jgi:F-type H+-transporting ATPase subunit delta
MAQKSKPSSSVATAYAKPLLDLAREQNQAEAIGEELSGLKEVVESNPNFAEFLANPAISEAERGEVLQRTFEGRVSPLLSNFLRVLNARKRLGVLPQISDAYDDLLDELFGKIEVDVTVAQRLTPDELEEVRRRVSEALGKEAVIHQYVDDSIIGGLLLRVQDRLIDASVRSQLRTLKNQMLAARPHRFGGAGGAEGRLGGDGQSDGNGSGRAY